MEEARKVKTVCRSCHGGCGVIAHVKDGRVIKVEGDSDSPISHGTMCTKGLAITQLAYHPDRVLYPMKRTDKGWGRISWDEALDTCVEKFNQVIDKYGPEAIVVGQGTGLGLNVAYNIVKNHNGIIKVRSLEGQGTSFLIRLPYE